MGIFHSKMGGRASKERASVSKSLESGGVTAAGSPVPEGQEQRGDFSDDAGPGDEGLTPGLMTAVTTASPCLPQESPDELYDDEKRLPKIRKIFVQYVPGKPYTVTYFGARLYSHHCRHVFRDVDGTGLAQAVGLRNQDELLSINNIETNLNNTIQLAVLECLTDVGTRIGLVIKRKKKGQDDEMWLFAFHLNEKDGRPVVETISRHRLDSGSEDNTFIELLPVETAFDVIPYYTFNRSEQSQLILESSDRFTEIGRTQATYVISSENVTLNYYDAVDSNPPGNTIAISQPGSPSRPMCIEGVDEGPLDVVGFPNWMTVPRTQIPQNNRFFFLTLRNNGRGVIKAANTDNDLYMTSNRDWVASLGTASPFRVESQGSSEKH